MTLKQHYLFLLLLIPVCSIAASADSICTLITQELPALMKEYGIPGAAVAVYAQGTPYLFHFGEADKATHRLVTKDTIFEIGSLTKVFTSILLALEIEEGQMKLTDRVSTYIKELADNPHVASITLLELATHTSKLPFDPPDIIKTEQELIDHLKKWKRTTKEPVCWGYSNHGTELLRIILERHTGSSINELYKQRILKPLNMTAIGCTVADKKYQAQYASCYDKKGKKTIKWDHPYMIATAALRASNKDMLHFLKASLGLAGVPPSLLKALRLTQSPFVSVNETFCQGLGWQISSLDTKKRTFPKSLCKL